MTQEGSKIHLVDGTQIVLGRKLGEGASGAVFRSATNKSEAVKIYGSQLDVPSMVAKLQAMLAISPSLKHCIYKGESIPQLAWPSRLVQQRNSGAPMGYIMPFVAHPTLEELLDKSSREYSGLTDFYYHRIQAAANLAIVFTSLHASDVHMVDLKPTNILVHNPSMYVTVIDCDGFSIRSHAGERFPAEFFSENFTAPELFGKTALCAGEQQDRFALAAVIFKLFNNGRHPFDGKGKTPQVKSMSIDERVKNRLYPYGKSHRLDIVPDDDSLHRYFEDQTIGLFDRAFTTTNRPSAKEWQTHLEQLIGALRTCNRRPHEHVHFSKGCMHCAIELGYSPTRKRSPFQQPATIPSTHSAQTRTPTPFSNSPIGVIEQSLVKLGDKLGSSRFLSGWVPVWPTIYYPSPHDNIWWKVLGYSLVVPCLLASLICLTIRTTFVIGTFYARLAERSPHPVPIFLACCAGSILGIWIAWNELRVPPFVQPTERIRPIVERKPQIPPSVASPTMEKEIVPPADVPSIAIASPSEDRALVDSRIKKETRYTDTGFAQSAGTCGNGVGTYSYSDNGHLRVQFETQSIHVKFRWREVHLFDCISYRGKSHLVVMTRGPQTVGVEVLRPGLQPHAYGQYCYQESCKPTVESLPKDFPVVCDIIGCKYR